MAIDKDPEDQLNKDLREAAMKMKKKEARFLVDAYYGMQKVRVASSLRWQQSQKSDEPGRILKWYLDRSHVLENGVRLALAKYTDQHLLSCWAKAVVGIGPVLSAGLMAEVDVTKPTVGHLWSFINWIVPAKIWKKGEKRPWNARLRTICWKCGDSFVKQRNHPKDIYGKLYFERKEKEISLNESGEYKEEAERSLAAKKYRRDTKAKTMYESGKLPPGHIDARARRWGVKIWLYHFHVVGHWIECKKLLPRPWIIDHSDGKHQHVLPPPNMGMIPGLQQAWDNREVNHSD